MDAAFQAGFASALLDVLFNKVTEVLCSEVRKFRECNQNLLKLKTTTAEAISALKKIDTSEMEGDTKLVVEETVRALTRLLLDGEDLMEDIAELTKRYSNSDDGSLRIAILKSPKYFTKQRDVYKLEGKVGKLLVQLKQLKELDENSEFEKGECSNRNHFNSTTDSLFGREDDVKEIMDHLLSTTSKSDGVSILGIDGLGKTSLAKTIEKKAGAHFVVLWVSVPGGDFNLSEIFNQLNQLQSAKQLLGNSSVLIIFDNLLKVALGDWGSMVSEIRRDGINGTTFQNIKFLITTFIPEVVQITHTTPHYLKPLRDQDCEKMIIATLQSMGRDLSKSSFTENVISSLARNSKGLSSVACLLGQFVAQFDAERVRKMLTEDLWDSDDFRNHIFPVIKSCYSGFKPELKRYLAYFSLFPATYHYAFTVDELVHLWVAEGFTHHPLGIPKTITLGIKHFHELQGMSIIRLSDQTTQNGMETYELNEFSHTFARLAASMTCASLAQGVSASKYTRHVFWCDSNYCPQWKDIKSKSLRTFFAQSNSKIDKIPYNAFKELTRLRVLSLSGTDVSELPGSIKLLRRLRYLNISHTNIKSLPDTLCKLTALQFLKIASTNHQGGRGLVCLPEEFANLTSMIYLDWDKSYIKRMTGLPPNIGKLTTLQTLPLYFVGVEDGHHISELKDMNQLRGSICINNLENVKDLDPSRLPLLDQKQFQEIELEWTKPNINRNDQDVLGCLKPWDYLKELKITNYHGYKFPNWMTDSSFQLEKLHLNTCPNVQGFLEKGSLPNLKVLVLEKLNNVVKINSAFFGEGSFPKLESLKILHMEELQEWKVGPDSNVMPCLQVIQFTCCPKLSSVCSVKHQSSLEHFEILRCKALTSVPDLPASLKKLIVEESDLLSERCKDGGADWTKVNRIPKVEIDFVEITTSGSISVTTPPGQQAQNSVGQSVVLPVTELTVLA